ncbi:MAG: glycosyltransferase [Butyrivibrio sp.]|nr:glycosyltransferase [Butyrivibrio sp.]
MKKMMQRMQNSGEKAPNDLITVVVTCYNIEKYIGRCLDSIMRQTYRNLEIIIIDDGSVDTSGAICDHYAAQDSRIRIMHTANGGPGIARNRAIEMAAGRYIAFVDGDDYIEPQMYEYMLTGLIRTGSEVAVCRHHSISVDDPKAQHPGGSSDLPEWVNVTELDRNELLTCLIEEDEEYPIRNAVWNKLYRTELLVKFRLPDQMYYEDILFTMKIMAEVKKACFIDMPMYNYIIDRKDSIMNQGMNRGILTDQIPAYQAKDSYLRSIGRQDLVDTHDYLVYKKLLLLYTQARRSHNSSNQKDMCELVRVIEGCRSRFEQIYSCKIADPHQKFRMKMFLQCRVLYNIFMDVNDGVIIPVRQKVHSIHRK